MRVLALFALLALAPTVSAFGLTATGPSAPIQPELDTAPLTVHLEATCQELLPRIDATGATTLRLVPETIDAVVLNGVLSADVDATPCLTAPASAITQDIPLTVAVTRDAPGLVAIPVAFQGTLEDKGALMQGSLQSDASTTVTPAFYGLVQALVDDTVKSASSSAEFQVQFTNFGNARTTVTLEIRDGEASRVELPDPIVIDSIHTGTNKVTVPIRIESTTNLDNYVVVVHLAATDDPSQTAQDITFDLSVRGRLIPGPPMPLVGLALLGAALVVRHR